MIQKMISSCGCVWGVDKRDIAISLVRVAVALVFIYHGFAKVMNPGQMIDGFLVGMLGIPSALAYLVAYIELLGGIAMLFGFFVEYIAPLFAIIMIVAIYLVHFKNGFNSMNGGYEFQFVLLLASIGLSLAGSKCFMIDKIMGKNDGKCVCKNS
jgi:putative oxidoreductase